LAHWLHHHTWKYKINSLLRVDLYNEAKSPRSTHGGPKFFLRIIM
jgi:hypothetical protein